MSSDKDARGCTTCAEKQTASTRTELSAIATIIALAALVVSIVDLDGEERRTLSRIKAEIGAKEPHFSYVAHHNEDDGKSVYDFLVTNSGGSIGREPIGTMEVSFTDRVDFRWRLRHDDETVTEEKLDDWSYRVEFVHMGRGSEFRFEIVTTGILAGPPVLQYANVPFLVGKCEFDSRYLATGTCSPE